MSDPNASGGGDFRGSREEKRQDETVMINADNLSDMVSQAKGAGAPTPAPAAEKSGPNLMLIGIGVAVLIVVLLVVIFVIAK